MRRTYGSLAWAIRSAATLLWRVRIDHPERIPAQGPVLILPTHASYLDPPLLGAMLPREVCFLAREGILRVPLLGWLARRLNAYPIRRGAGDRDALRTCEAILRAGWPLVFFPEGTRTATGRLGEIKPGFALILERVPGTPYVPIVMRGTFAVLPRGAWLPRPGRIEIRVGEPATLPARRTGEPARAYYERCARDLEARWRALGAEA